MKKIIAIAIACTLLFSGVLVVGGSILQTEQQEQTFNIFETPLKQTLKEKLTNIQLPTIIQNFLEKILSIFLPMSDSSDPTIEPLYAGQNILVGEIHVWNDDSNLYVKYVITDTDWWLTETHVHVGFTLDDFPLTKKGNPQVGHFDYQTTHDCVTEYTYTIPFGPWGCDDTVLIGTHAVVETLCGYEDPVYDPGYFEANLPNQVTFKVTYPVGGGQAYFPNTYVYGLPGGDINIYGWCVDTDNVIYQNTVYTANLYSSYEASSLGAYVEYPENLPMVNWILNQGYIGQISPGCGGVYTYGDVQRAIWSLVEDTQSTSGLGSWSQCRVDEILAAASTHGAFEPECGDIIGIILVPVGGQQVLVAQAILGEYAFPCYEEPIYCDETAWAGPNDFGGNSWATYFEYTIICGNGGGGGDCQEETAFGGDTQGTGTTWWYYYDTTGLEMQDIWAGQTIDVGYVTISEPNTDGDVTITINLEGGWTLQAVTEPVKIQGYDVLPSERPSAGLFTTYKGDQLVVTVPSSAYFVIHLDVELCP